MNERIKELSNIAYMNHIERNPHSSFGRRYDYDKEFAELIVRECAKFLDENSGYDDSFQAWHPEPEEMLQHFGIEK